MSALDKESQRTIVQAGVAAVNHGMWAEARQILDALPLLMPAGSDRDRLAALMWLGLGQADRAWPLVEDDASPEGELLRNLIADARDASPTPEVAMALAAAPDPYRRHGVKV